MPDDPKVLAEEPLWKVLREIVTPQPFWHNEAAWTVMARLVTKEVALRTSPVPVQMEEAVAALKFYADDDGDGYDVMVTNYGLSTEEGDIIRDRGERARAALSSLSGGLGRCG